MRVCCTDRTRDILHNNRNEQINYAATIQRLLSLLPVLLFTTGPNGSTRNSRTRQNILHYNIVHRDENGAASLAEQRIGVKVRVRISDFLRTVCVPRRQRLTTSTSAHTCIIMVVPVVFSWNEAYNLQLKRLNRHPSS
jgi:hypothetical protein